MKASLHTNGAEHQQAHMLAMRAGLARHGIQARLARFNQPEPCDFAVVWGGKQPRVLDAGRPVLIMERGHLGDRMVMTSIGWDGLGRRARYPTVTDGGARWGRYAHLMQPWRWDTSGDALLIGQVPTDASLRGLDFTQWAQEVADELGRTWRVVYRPHPLAGDTWCPRGADRSVGTLVEDLARAELCATFNSTAGVEAVLAGVPTITMDEGAMAWPVTSHAVADAPIRPERESWAHDLAWTQWSRTEIQAGEAWARLAPLMETA